MKPAIRPTHAFILRLWREPGDQEGDAGWRGVLRPVQDAQGEHIETAFRGLENLTEALRPWLTEKARRQQSGSTDKNPTE